MIRKITKFTAPCLALSFALALISLAPAAYADLKSVNDVQYTQIKLQNIAANHESAPIVLIARPDFLANQSSFSAVKARQDAYQIKPKKKISAKKAKKIARKKVKNGEVVDIALKVNIYKVRIIAPEGRVVDVYIDAHTGQVKK